MASTAQLIAKLESYLEGDIRDLRIDLGEMDPENPANLQELLIDSNSISSKCLLCSFEFLLECIDV